jgi:hypothetical protein
MEWIHLAQDRDHQQDVVNAVMNLSGSGTTELVNKFKKYKG